jgi:excisionase family DNA binding protein
VTGGRRRSRPVLPVPEARLCALAIRIQLNYESNPKSGKNDRVREVYSLLVSEGAQRMPEQLLTLEQVAEYLNVDKFTVYRLLADKELPAFKVGNQWRFKRKLIENWLMKNSNVKRKDTQ